MNLDLSEEQKLIQETARDFAKSELEPVAAKLDETKDRPTLLANLKKLAELGFMGLNIKDPEAHRWAQSIAPINWRKHDPYRNPGLA